MKIFGGCTVELEEKGGVVSCLRQTLCYIKRMKIIWQSTLKDLSQSSPMFIHTFHLFITFKKIEKQLSITKMTSREKQNI